MMKYLIVGRSGVGKDTLAQALCDRYGMTQVMSYTTRPKRNAQDESHLFIDEKDVHQISDKIAMTTVNDHLYFATKAQMKQHDIFVVDPNGVFDLARSMPETQFALVYLRAEDNLRKNFAIARAEDHEDEALIFDRRDQKEKAIYDDFEARLEKISEKALAPNINVIYQLRNVYSSQNLDKNITEIIQQDRLFDHTVCILQNLLDIGVLRYIENRVVLAVDDDDPDAFENDQLRLVEYTKEELALLMLSNRDVFNQFMKTWLVFFEPGRSNVIKMDTDDSTTSSN